MHRDVSVKNLLVMSVNPPRAVLCDYGKVVFSACHMDSRIGPISSLAPEVTGKSPYDQKIDVWGIGYVCCWILFPIFQNEHVKGDERPNKAWHKDAMTQMTQYEARSGPLERSFADLIRHMLAWSPGNRLTAAQALRHPCMQPDSLSAVSSSDSEDIRPAPIKFAKTAHTKPRILAATTNPATPHLNQTEDGPSGDTELLTSFERPSSLEDYAQGTGAAMLAFHADRERAKAQDAYQAMAPHQLLRRR